MPLQRAKSARVEEETTDESEMEDEEEVDVSALLDEAEDTLSALVKLIKNNLGNVHPTLGDKITLRKFAEFVEEHSSAFQE